MVYNGGLMCDMFDLMLKDFEINLEEFLNGCVELRGPAKAVDLFALRTQTGKVRDTLAKISHELSLIVEQNSARPLLGTRVSDEEMSETLLGSLPQLLELEGPHEVASIEEDPHVSDAGARLVRHALGEHLSHVRHLPLVTGEETTLLELLQSLREGYDLPSFDLVVLGGRNVQGCVLEVQDLLKSQALRPRGVVLAIFDDDAAQMYLHEIGPEFDSVVTDDPDGATTVMSVWQRERKEL
ncbi:Protein NLRC3 [Durusdinium trenchii]|uniref:Protein NLRC3 n=1 Tax=Durusdinium trenchii TaxID=1381693 RepID=A0ABP0L0X5_9DINO